MIAGTAKLGDNIIRNHQGTGSPQTALGRGDSQAHVAQLLAEYSIRDREMLRRGDKVNIIRVGGKEDRGRGTGFGAVQRHLVAKSKKSTAEGVALASAGAEARVKKVAWPGGPGGREGVERAEEG